MLQATGPDAVYLQGDLRLSQCLILVHEIQQVFLLLIRKRQWVLDLVGLPCLHTTLIHLSLNHLMFIYNLHRGNKVYQREVSVEQSKEGQATARLGTQHEKPGLLGQLRSLCLKKQPVSSEDPEGGSGIMRVQL